MQNFEFLRENGMFKRVQSLPLMKPIFIFCVYKNLFLGTSWLLTEMTLDTPAISRNFWSVICLNTFITIL